MGEVNASRRRLSPATRGIYRAIGLLGSAQSIGMLCSLVRNKLVAMWVGQAGIALVGILNAAVEMVGSVAQQGLRTSAVGPVAAAVSTPRFGRVAAGVASCGLIVGLASALLMLLLSPLLSRLSFGNSNYTWAFAAMGLAVLLNALAASRQAIAQGSGALARIARASLTGSVGGMILSIPLIWFFRIDALPWVIVVYSAATAIAYLFPRLTLPAINLSDTLADCSAILRLGLWLTLSSAVGWAVSYLFMSWLHTRGGSYTVGLYQSGYTVAIRYVGVLFSAIAMEFYPRLTLRVRRSPLHPALLIAHETGVILRLAVPGALLLILLSPWILSILYSPDFIPSAPFMAGALAATPLRALSWCTAFMIIARGEGRTYLLVETASGLICLVLSSAMYLWFGLAGIGVAFVSWYLLYSIIVIAVCRKRYELRLPSRLLLSVGMCTLMLSVAALAIVKIY